MALISSPPIVSTAAVHPRFKGRDGNSDGPRFGRGELHGNEALVFDATYDCCPAAFGQSRGFPDRKEFFFGCADVIRQGSGCCQNLLNVDAVVGKFLTDVFPRMSRNPLPDVHAIHYILLYSWTAGADHRGRIRLGRVSIREYNAKNSAR